MKNWYVIQVYAGQEMKAKNNIERLISQKNLQTVISEINIPMMNVSEIKNGKKTIVQKKVMPGYIVVNIDLNEELRYMIQRLPSISTFVCSGNGVPKPLSEEELKNITSFEERTEATSLSSKKTSYQLGDRLKIIDGPFSNFFGLVDEVFPDKGRLRLKVEIFGRSTPVELDFLQVQREMK